MLKKKKRGMNTICKRIMYKMNMVCKSIVYMVNTVCKSIMYNVNIVCKNYSVEVNTVCKMTICKAQREYEDNLQEHGLQFSLPYTRTTRGERKKLTSKSFQGPTNWHKVP